MTDSYPPSPPCHFDAQGDGRALLRMALKTSLVKLDARGKDPSDIARDISKALRRFPG